MDIGQNWIGFRGVHSSLPPSGRLTPLTKQTSLPIRSGGWSCIIYGVVVKSKFSDQAEGPLVPLVCTFQK